MNRGTTLAWAPAFFAGAAAATAAEIAMGLLLYSGPGLVRSFTVILAVEAAAVSLGLWTAPAPGRSDVLLAVRRRWLLSLGVFLLATVYSVGWSVLDPVSGGPLGQGLGLALLGALPLYAAAGVLGGMSAAAAETGDHSAHVAAAAFAGAVVGFAVTGVALPRVPAPASLFLGCLILLSGGGLMWGGALDRRVRVQVKSRRPSPWGEVTVSDRCLPEEDAAVRVLAEGGHIRRWMTVAPGGAVPWETALFRAWAAGGSAQGRVLLVGGGASGLPVSVVMETEGVEVDVMERNPAVPDVAAECFDTPPRESGRVRTMTGVLDDHLAESTGAYDLVVVDIQGLEAAGGVTSLSRACFKDLFRAAAPGGVVCFGPVAPGRPLPPEWQSRILSRRVEGLGSGLGLAWPGEERVLVASLSGDLPWLDKARGFEVQAEVPQSVPPSPPLDS